MILFGFWATTNVFSKKYICILTTTTCPCFFFLILPVEVQIFSSSSSLEPNEGTYIIHLDNSFVVSNEHQTDHLFCYEHVEYPEQQRRQEQEHKQRHS